MNPTVFGTAETLAKDKEWFARYNQAKTINVLAEEEYKLKRGEVRETIERMIRHPENQQRLINAVVGGRLVHSPLMYKSVRRQMDHSLWLQNLRHQEKEEAKTRRTHRMGRQSYDPVKVNMAVGPKFSKKGRLFRYNYYSHQGTIDLFDPDTHRVAISGNLEYTCPILGGKCTLVAALVVKTHFDLATVCGCKVDVLPEFVQRYYSRLYGGEPYHGNQILDRVDPMEWVLQNPWREECFTVRVTLSRKGYNNRRVKFKLKALHGDDWKEIQFHKDD